MHPRLLKFLFIGILLVCTQQFVLAQVQGGSISGLVTDAEFSDALPYARIYAPDLKRSTYCDDQGNFILKNVAAGQHTILVSFVGYEEANLSIDLKEGEAIQLDIKLETSNISAEEVVVTASKKKQHFSLAPASIALLTSKQINKLGLNSFDEAFDQMNGLSVTRSSGSNVQAVSIRGASEVAGGGIGNRVLLLIDGRPAISPESGGALWNLIPLNSVERIEVVKGAYSSLFGSSAMGGVVNVITRKPGIKSRTGLRVNYGFFDKAPSSTGYDRYNDFYSLGLNRSGRSGRMSYVFDSSFRSTDGHREKTAFDLFNIYSNIKYKFSGNRSLSFSGNYNRIKNDTPATWFSASEAYSVADYRMDDFQERRETNFDLFYEAIANEKLKYSSRFYYYENFSEYFFDDDPENDSTNVNLGTSQVIDYEYVLSRRLGNVSQVDWYSKDKHYLIAGLESYYDFVNGVPDTILYGKHKAWNVGVYVQDEIQLNEKLSATLGLRYDHYSIVDQFSESNLSPKVALLYKWTDKISSRALVAQAYRTPSIAERFIKFEQGGGLRFEANPDLQSEKLNLSLELGSIIRFNEKLSMDVALFYNHYENLISYQQLSNSGEALLYRVINLKESVMQGFEWEMKWKASDHFDFGLGYTFLDAKDVSEDRINDELAYKVKHSGFFSMNGDWKSWSLNLNGRYRSDIKEVFIYPGNEPAGYFLANTKLSYGFGESHSAFLTVQNIGDAQYEELERYRMAGRSFSMGLQLQF